MNARRTAARALTASAVAASIAAGGAAQAAANTHADPAKDVVLVGNQGKASKAPGYRSSDITKFTVTHTANKVVTVVRLRDLVKKESMLVIEMEVEGANKHFRAVWVLIEGMEGEIDQYVT